MVVCIYIYWSLCAPWLFLLWKASTSLAVSQHDSSVCQFASAASLLRAGKKNKRTIQNTHPRILWSIKSCQTVEITQVVMRQAVQEELVLCVMFFPSTIDHWETGAESGACIIRLSARMLHKAPNREFRSVGCFPSCLDVPSFYTFNYSSTLSS